MDLAVVALTVLLAQTVRGVTGFGSALITVPVAAALWSPAEAILLATVLDLVGGVALVPPILDRLRWRVVGLVALCMVPGQLVGSWAVTWLPADVVRVVVAVAVASIGVDTFLRPVRVGQGELSDLPDAPGVVLRDGALAGLAGGLMQGIVGTPGPPLVVYARRHFDDRFGRAQLIGIFCVGAVTLVAALLVAGAGSASLGWRTLLLSPLVLIGARTGAWLAPRVGRVAFARVVGVLLVGAAAALIRAVLSG